MRTLVKLAMWTLIVGLGLTPTLQAESVLSGAKSGNPEVKSIQVIAFAPGGVLLVGDGTGAQVVAVATGDTKAQPWWAKPIENLDAQLAGRLGVPAKGIEILHLAVNPASGSAYLAVRNQSAKKDLILRIDGSGKIDEFVLESVEYVAVPLPSEKKGGLRRITDLSWGNGRVMVAALSTDQFASKVYSIPAPLSSASQATIFSTETYHVSHRKWETRAPITSLLTFEQEDEPYVVGAFACTPVVKYPLRELKAGAKVKGRSVIELGSGNRPLNMFSYTRGEKTYVLMNTFRFHHKRRPFGPSPYWTVRIEESLLAEDEAINEKAVRRLKGNDPATDRMQMVEAYHGVRFMDRLDAKRALVVQEDKEGNLTLKALDLP